MISSDALARASRVASRARLRASHPSAASAGISALKRGRVKLRSRLVGSSANPIFALSSVASSRPLGTSSNGRASTTPSRGDSRAIAPSPASPLPRDRRIRKVSA